MFKIADKSDSIMDETDRILSELSDKMAMTLMPAMVILGLIMLIGFVGNCLVFYVYYIKFTSSSARTAILTLACYDLLTCTISIPGEIVDMRYSFSFTSEILCRGMRTVTTIILVASGLTLVAVAVDRYQRICQPLDDHYTSKQIRRRVILLCAMAAIIAIPSPIVYGVAYNGLSINNHNITAKECSTSQDYKNHPLQMVYSIILLIVFLVAFTTMIFIYILIGKQVLRQNSFRKAVRQRSGSVPAVKVTSNKASGSSQDDNNEPSFVEVKDSSALHEMDHDNDNPSVNADPGKHYDKKRPTRRQSVMHHLRKVSRPGDIRTRKTTMMLFFITLVFVISFLPHIILKAIQAFNKNFDQSLGNNGIIFYNIFVRSYFFNTAVNFFVYGFCSPKFRAECRTLVFRLAFWIKQRRASIRSEDIQ